MQTDSKGLLLKLTPEEYNNLRTESQKLGISMTAFIKLLIKQWYDGITFEKKPIIENHNNHEIEDNNARTKL